MKNKKLTVYISENAENELEDIFEHIAIDSKRQARKVVNEIKVKIKDLNIMPEKFPKEPNSMNPGRNVRFFPIYSYKIIYEIKTDKIMVLSIFHTSQSPNKISKL